MFQMPVRVSASHVDADCLCTPVALLNMLQDCSLFWFEEERAARQWLREANLGTVLTSRQVDIVRRPRYGEHLQVRTGIYGFRGYLGYRNTWIYDENDEPVVKCWCMGAFIDLASGKMSRIPSEVTANNTTEEQLPMEYLSHKIALPACAPQRLAPVRVAPTDIDLNNHMNNTQYVRLVCDALPQQAKDCTRMRMEYKSQVRLGDALALDLYLEDAGRTVVTLNNQDDVLCAVVELS